MMVANGGNLVHLVDDPDAGILILAWILGDHLFLKNRVWLAGWS